MSWYAIDEQPTLWYARNGLRTAPPVMLLHGFASDHCSWQALAETLGHHWDIVAPDLPGHGKTQLKAGITHVPMAQSADDLTSLMNTLRPSPFVIVGYSMGGRLALHIATQHLPHVAGLVLISSSPGLADYSAQATRRQQDERLAQLIIQRGVDWFLSYWEALPLFASDGHQSPPIRCLSPEPCGLATSLLLAGTGQQHSLWNELPRVTFPTLLITGQKDQKFTEIAQQMSKFLPDVHHHIVPGAGHRVPWDAPDSTHQLVIDFLHMVWKTREVG